MSHTPGPHTQEVFYNKIGSTGAVVCSCGFAITFTALADNREEAGRAFFARMHEHRDGLIAAAPELLKACQYLSEWVEHTVPTWTPEVECGLQLAKDAIAKATGGAL